MTGDFLPVPAWVVGRSDVSWGAKVLLGALYAYDRKRRTEWPSVGQLCEDMKAPRRTVTRWLEELTGAGLVTSNRDGREVLYAPSTCAKTGVRRDLDSSAEHAPEVAHVEPSERRSEVAHVPAGHGSEVAHVANSHLLLRERDLRERSARASFEGPSEGPDPLIRAALIRGYAERYVGATGKAWMSHGQAAAHIDTAARWCATEAEPLAAAAAVLDGAFGDEWMTKNRWPWGSIAKDPARFADAGQGVGAERAKAAQAQTLNRLKREADEARARGDHDRAADLDRQHTLAAFAAVPGAHPVPAGSGAGGAPGTEPVRGAPRFLAVGRRA